MYEIFDAMPYDFFEFIPLFVLIAAIVFLQWGIANSRNRDRQNGKKRAAIHNELTDRKAKLKKLTSAQTLGGETLEKLTGYLTKNFKAPCAITLINRCVGAEIVDLNTYRLYEKQKIESDLGEVIHNIKMGDGTAPKTRDDLLALQTRLRDRLAEIEQEKYMLVNEIKELEIKEVMWQ